MNTKEERCYFWYSESQAKTKARYYTNRGIINLPAVGICLINGQTHRYTEARSVEYSKKHNLDNKPTGAWTDYVYLGEGVIYE